MASDMQEWTRVLALRMQKAVLYLSRSSEVDIYLLQCDCHPWDGQLGMAALTVQEFESDPELAYPEEMAAWKMFDFTAELDFWKEDLQKQMQDDYASSVEKSDMVVVYFKAVAQVLRSIDTSSLNSSSSVILSVCHPDSGDEFI